MARKPKFLPRVSEETMKSLQHEMQTTQHPRFITSAWQRLVKENPCLAQVVLNACRQTESLEEIHGSITAAVVLTYCALERQAESDWMEKNLKFE